MHYYWHHNEFLEHFQSIFSSTSPDIQPNITFFTEIIAIEKPIKDLSLATLGKKNEENYKKWQNFDEIWDIEANLSILIVLIILKKNINKMLYFVAFICLFLNANFKYMFCSFWAMAGCTMQFEKKLFMSHLHSS